MLHRMKLHLVTSTRILLSWSKSKGKKKKQKRRKKQVDLLRVSGDTIATVVHLAHKDLHTAIPGLGLFKRVLEPPLDAVGDHLPQRHPALTLLPLRALHQLLLLHSLRFEPNSPRFSWFWGRDSDLRYGFCAFWRLESARWHNFCEFLEFDRWRKWFSHITSRERERERGWKRNVFNIEGWWKSI